MPLAVVVDSEMPSTAVRALLASLSSVVCTGLRGVGRRPPGPIVSVGGDL